MPVIKSNYFAYEIRAANGRVWFELSDLHADIEIDEDGEILAVEAIHGHYQDAPLPETHPLWPIIAEYIVNVADSEEILPDDWKEHITPEPDNYDLAEVEYERSIRSDAA